MSEAIEEPGYFWLPDNPGSRLPGTLRISETGKSSLEIIGSFSDPLDVNALKNPEPLKRVLVSTKYAQMSSRKFSNSCNQELDFPRPEIR